MLSSLAFLVPFVSLALGAPAATLEASASVGGHPEFSRTLIAKVRDNAIAAATQSWEFGTLGEALIEFDTPGLGVFEASKVAGTNLSAPALKLVDDAIAAKKDGVKYFYATGAVGDMASIGSTALTAYVTTGNAVYLEHSAQQLDFLLNDAPHDGIVISHRNETFQAWADFISMAPPFIAYYGALTHNKTLLLNAYEQMKGYRAILQDTETGLWRHILRGSWSDKGLWLTGNAWAAWGSLRIERTLTNSFFADELKDERDDLLKWSNEILAAVWAVQRGSGAMLNYMDLPDDNAKNFEDSAGTTLLAAAQFRLATITGKSDNIEHAERAMQRMLALTDEDGWLHGPVDPYAFDKPATGHSPEAQSFLVILDVSARAYYDSLKAKSSSLLDDFTIPVQIY